MNISDDVLSVLASAQTDGNSLRLTGQLDRSMYVKVAKTIEAAGGKWNRKEQAHLFRSDAASVVAQMLGNGSVVSERTEQQFFQTPPSVVDRLIRAADLSESHIVLEPSAGEGAIASRLAPLVSGVACIELYEQHASVIRSAGYARTLTIGDFLSVEPVPVYDRVVMNPPFSRNRDIIHVQHALRFLRPAGMLVSVMSAGTLFRTDRVTSDFRRYVSNSRGRLDVLPDGAFAKSGTNVKTIMVIIPAYTP